MRIVHRSLVALLGCCLLSACAGLTVRKARDKELDVETYRVSDKPDPELGVSSWSATTLFRLGESHFEAQEYPEALHSLERMVREFPESKYIAPAYLLLGATHIRVDEAEEALPWFERYLDEYPHGSQRWYAIQGLGDAYAALEDWAESEMQARRLLALSGLESSIVDGGKARLARALIEQGRLDDGAALLEEAIARHGPTARLEDGLPDDTDTGPMARFYFGEIARLRSERIVLKDAVDLERAEGDLEQKAQYVLEAHHHYYRTFSYGQPAWTAKAAYRMAYIYERFYQDLMNSPPPPELSEEDVDLYREAMQEQLSLVVKRAVDLYGQVVRNAERLQLEGEWVERCRDGIARLEEEIKTSEPDVENVSPLEETPVGPEPVEQGGDVEEPSGPRVKI